MFGGVVAILIALWYYRTAEARKLPTVQWAFAGVICYYIPNIAWSLMIAKPWLNTLHAAPTGSVMATVVGFSSVFVGAFVAILVYFLFLPKGPAQKS